MNSAQRVLGFDFGLRRIGVAVGNELTGTSQSVVTVDCSGDRPNWKHIAELVEEWQPKKLVVGLPLSMDGSENTMSQLARNFATQLSQRLQLPICLVDERLSSNQADVILRESTAKGKKIKKKHLQARDNLAARLILQTYFEDN